MGDVLVANADAYPHKAAYVSASGARLTFREYNERVNRLNDAVAALGVAKGDRVAILARNCVETMEVYGLGKSGIIMVALNWRLTADELAALLAHGAPRILFADSKHAQLIDTLRDKLGGVSRFVLFDGERDGWTTYGSLLAGASSTEPATPVEPDDVLALIYTSGTTGQPKGVAVTHRGVLDNARTIVQDLLVLREDDVCLGVMPLFHSGGMWYYTFPSHAAGCTVVLLPEFSAETVVASLEAHRITTVHLVPTMLAALVAHPRIAAVESSALRLIFYAASAMPAALLTRAMEVFRGVEFAQSYGSTEGGVLTVLTPADHRRAREPGGDALLSSCGRAFPRREVRILDEHDAEQAPGGIGEITIRSSGTMREYWRDPPATRRVLTPEGWLRMGDVGYVDAAGYLFLVDRKNDVIVSGGENVYPSEVESALYRDTAVAEAAVFAVPDPRWVERVVAAVVRADGDASAAGDIIARLRTQLAGYKCPKQIHFVDSLPKNGAGKVLRKALRQQFGG